MNFTHLLIKALIPFIIVVLVSCEEIGAPVEETNYVDIENAEWLTNNTVNSGFQMVDNNGITYSFTMVENTSDISPTTTSYLGIQTKVINNESYFQSFTSNMGKHFSISISANFKPFGDVIHISLDNLSFRYDLKFQEITDIYFNSKSISKTMFEDHYDDTKIINSTINLIDTLGIDSILYFNVLHFNFADFIDDWDKFTIIDIYLAKNIGLVKYCLKNEVFYLRKKNEE